MSRILLTWELGLNLGHLARLLPVAQQLEKDGHTVLVATRDIQAAASILMPVGIPFVQAPYLAKGIPLAHRPAGYADILLSQGWSDPVVLGGLTRAWLNVIRLFGPDRLVLDYSPTVALAARIAGIPVVLIGNGFELPPEADPLPCFPGFSWATPAKAAESESAAVANANRVLTGFRAKPISALRDLTLGQAKLLSTFPEVDHYGPRPDAQYIGPLLPPLSSLRIDWPKAAGPKVFASLRPDTSQVRQILEALGELRGSVVCVTTGFSASQLEPFRKSHIQFSLQPVDLNLMLKADLCISYGAEGTMLKFLSAGVPQLVSPWHVETYMAVRRLEAAGLGASFAAQLTDSPAVEAIEHLIGNERVRTDARDFARRSKTVPLAELALLIGDSGVPLSQQLPAVANPFSVN